MQVVSVDVDTFSQYYLVAMATSNDKLERKIQIHHRTQCTLYDVKIAIIGSIDPEILDQIGRFFGHVIPDVHK